MLCRQLWGLLEPSLNKHSHQEKASGNNKCPLTAERTKNGNTALHSLSASSAGSGKSCRSRWKDDQEINVRLLSPAKGYALSVGGHLSLYRGTFV